jgi:hypothetical protein
MFHEIQEISWLPEELFASREGFCSMEPVSQEQFSHSTTIQLNSVKEECNMY